ncbi:DNA methylase [Rhodobacter phage RcSaxon]|uniref:DNA methylase n=1 Tax=Rhodobacter phage RcSaxon TaxID=1698423 RepID=A0A0K1Y757_9CAUD|nr:DNA methylase [Rhodobacter phage RcSaxon]
MGLHSAFPAPAGATLHPGDCLAVMAGLPADHYDAVVTDPPYHLLSIVRRFGKSNAAPAQEGTDGNFARSSRGFMGKEWDGGDIAFRPETWAEVLRVLKPGAHLAAFNHSRTWHRMTAAIEDAGFEIRDSVLDLYATGPAWADFLDSLTGDQIKGLARALAYADRAALAWIYGTGFPKSHNVAKALEKAGAPLDQIAAGQGWGTALKPAFEPIVLARKPLAETSVARQFTATGTGALNIDAARLPSEGRRVVTGSGARDTSQSIKAFNGSDAHETDSGRWPANITTDGSADVLAALPLVAGGGPSVARTFYSAKASAEDRRGSTHPTVKPQSLMRWLVRLLAPRGGLILDPFGGSGSTAWAAVSEGVSCHLIEREPEYQADIRRGIESLAMSPAAATAPDALPGQASLFDL